MTQPKFIVVEGTCDGAGKTTLVRNLEAALNARGISVLKTHEPGGSVFGPQMRQIFLDPDIPLNAEAELFLMLAERAQHTDKIREAMAADRWVISDRYSLSTVAYQGLRHGFDGDFFWAACLRAQRGLVPDLTLLLDMPSELMAQRLEGRKLDRFEQSDPSFFVQLRKRYLEVCMGTMFSKCTVLLDATLSPVQVVEAALGHIDRFFGESIPH